MAKASFVPDVPLSLYFGELGLPKPELEYRFCPTRRWKFDYAYVKEKVAIEVQGGIWTRGRHSRPFGQIGDMEKLNRAQIMGWIVLQFTPSQIRSGYFSIMLREALEARSAKI